MLYPSILAVIQSLDSASISDERKKHLVEIAKAIEQHKKDHSLLNLQFICTHNSRRSHFAQIWAQTLEHYFGLANLHCYSGGTEVTALNENVIETLKTQGFAIDAISDGENPIYSIKIGENVPAVIGFSKKYDHHFNPESKFVAVMTCDHADQNCPFIPGAKLRLSLPFLDPKKYDGSGLEATKYAECSLQIATELNFIFSKLKPKPKHA